ncbi:hypothetical protein [Leifsonia soli]|uniref:Multidrug resistance protein MdtA-like C-terminal permuted SH3 domain-containing protein n=1 Tax=Leifsonia soli TaxID=582665 RepID=A0A852SYX8_9MICO|nr:hypothetical protein [Leifsonia soli]NYD73842.1 hypothetical protein [Leifsonia soli]
MRIRRRADRRPVDEVGIDDLIPGDDSAAAPAGTDGQSTPAASGWSRVLRGNRLLWLVAGASVVCLAAGYAGGALLSSADAAETPGKGGPITVPVESRVLSNTVKLRGDAAFDDAVEVKVAAGDLEGPAVVTGTVPEVGATLDALSVALEVAGRPVIVLPGALPAYRTLRAGQKGPDVAQLKEALRAVGIDPGASDVYDAATANAVVALYQRVGYAPPAVKAEAKSAVEGAQEAVAGAEKALASAQRELAAASKGADAARRVELENAVRDAERELATARSGGDGSAIARAEDALRLAQTQLSVGLSAPDTSAESGAVGDARKALAAAQEDLAKANEEALTPLPANEVQFLPTLPRRVDEVRTARGKILEGAAMTVSGATLAITARATAADAELLKSGLAASIELPDGSELAATVTNVKPRKADEGEEKKSGRSWDVALALISPTPKQVEQLRGQNVRVIIPVKATAGKVLVVPAAALTAGPGGESRVEVAKGDATRVVTVKTGLAADGLVEISGKIAAGDRVVVGR